MNQKNGNLEGKAIELMQTEQQKEKKTLKSEDTSRNKFDNIKCNNIHILWVLEEEERKAQRTHTLFLVM